MQIDGMNIGIKIPASYDGQPGKLLPHIIIFLVNDGHFQIAAADVSNDFSITNKITACNVNVIIIDAVTFRRAVFVEHPASEITGLSHIFHCSKPSFSLICIYRIHLSIDILHKNYILALYKMTMDYSVQILKKP